MSARGRAGRGGRGGRGGGTAATRRLAAAPALGLLALGVLAACTDGDRDRTPQVASPRATAQPAPPAPSATAPVTPSAGPTEQAARYPAGPSLPAATDEPQDVLTGLNAPWSLAFLPPPAPGTPPAVLLTQRDEATVLLLTAEGVSAVSGPGAEALRTGTWTAGEAGLLGVAVDVERSDPATGTARVVLYRSTTSGNEVLAAPLDTATGELGELEVLLDGIPAGRTHDGGRIAFGPDGMLWVATGDAGVRDASQDPASPAGKILRLAPDGEPAPGNPVEGSPVWSLGHRNVQGLGWDATGALVASEFGQNTWDEVNVVEPGGNHGWPVVEGRAERTGYVDPAVVWSPSEASPSGLAVGEDGVAVAGLRGQRLWWLPFRDHAAGAGGGFGEPEAALEGLGRLRDVVLGPDGAWWVLTNNTDGRGDPREGDDRLVRVALP